MPARSMTRSHAIASLQQTARFSYRSCPLCSTPLLVRIHGSFVYKWLNSHFAKSHHEFMHLVVNLHPSNH
ncbi:hypothetical protein PHYBLDRAFT_141767 [Phycomyces blakesleeanus NRRL 1555(-)]|uniref:Uncharacterized protein n=1 Tax=Phycomyces blakesleeanus (strain ATCC 8743b / DSM 1359 / FGSC 10004 / NBRC 33097 / NRRL 1555) TaxID=763407 RepID=A0A162UTA0_PHYB8|nr:hypothetical protein PHYBLDRAFT_141767 [Phycomyces blakesleeanus NRRL 1555(-)]OAD77902.1 hypothetical protein PHYBLDRAFT_141767 [Phycomyces blakesleeanus NRRL 1555(-)]|eukprot:XP_018295942.1 hypothetical protein PHYBLDRAFT_141767 [Phycomyces blakesleeanus NRRL 1555(-)]